MPLSAVFSGPAMRGALIVCSAAVTAGSPSRPARCGPVTGRPSSWRRARSRSCVAGATLLSSASRASAARPAGERSTDAAAATRSGLASNVRRRSETAAEWAAPARSSPRLEISTVVTWPGRPARACMRASGSSTARRASLCAISPPAAGPSLASTARTRATMLAAPAWIRRRSPGCASRAAAALLFR